MVPKILLSAKMKADNYVEAVRCCGGEPTVNCQPGLQDQFDGLVLCGGGDIHPRYYGENINGSNGIDPERDEYEFSLTKSYVEKGKPVLGICRGLQLLNVYFGGSLEQDLGNAKEHASFADYDLTHLVRDVDGGLFRELYGSEFMVNSYHHQAIKKLGEGLSASLVSEDGLVVEGFVHETLPIIAVQWHPERMCFQNKREDTVDGSKLIQYFVDLCKNT